MKPEILLAIKQLTSEKALNEDVVFEAVERGMAAAVKRGYELPGHVVVQMDRIDGGLEVWSEREVVEIEEDIEDGDLQIELVRAREIDPNMRVSSVLRLKHDVGDVGGRIEAQTAKQVVLQALREAEREAVFAEYSGQEGGIVSGMVQRIEPNQVIIDLGRTEAVLPGAEQVRMERYRSGQRIKAIMIDVERANKGPQVILSRTRADFVRRLFELEVPEIARGIVEIRGIAREPGHRSKVAVATRQAGVDPVGACVGMRAIRIQNVVNELSGERVDVIEYDRDPRRFVEHALSPAQVLAVRIDPETNTAEVAVPDMQLSLAIGREGQNARLAARLTGYRIDIKPQTVAERLSEEERGPFAPQVEFELAPESSVEAVVSAPAVPEVEVEESEPERAAAEVVSSEEESGVSEPAAAAAVKEESEPEAEPVLAATEIAGAGPSSGQIRFGEDVLRRESEEPRERRRRRRPRYVEIDEGLEEDPYAEYEDEF